MNEIIFFEPLKIKTNETMNELFEKKLTGPSLDSQINRQTIIDMIDEHRKQTDRRELEDYVRK